jgi:succinate dehydrogenase/fumarate reductase flavoprotein subunit
MSEALLLRDEEVAAWDATVDVIVAGYGVAGACAALEAHAAGAAVLIIERASGGGGASAMSSGIFYLGGGTAVQTACGYADDAETMYRFLLASCGGPDAALVHSFCTNSRAHFDWLEAQGVPFERTCFKGKAVFLNTTECLFYTGNEKLWPWKEIASPAPRGHKVAGTGENAGAVGMHALIASCERNDIPAMYDSRIDALVRNARGRVTGARVKRAEGTMHVRARGGVVLATGSFNLNADMVAKHLPQLSPTSEPLGISNNDGTGITLGVAAGAATSAMDGVIATASFYPPAQLIRGILVNKRGERFVAEDSYHGRTAGFIMEQPDQAAWLIVDSEIFAYPEIAMHRHRLVDGWETVPEMEAGLGLPEGALQRTLREYNRHAADGRDPFLHKDAEWLKPLDAGPYAAFDVSFDKSIYLFIALGGLRTNADAEVVSQRGAPIPGLYAAGACAAHIPRTGKTYASGLSLGPGSWFGRVAGRNAAAHARGD